MIELIGSIITFTVPLALLAMIWIVKRWVEQLQTRVNILERKVTKMSYLLRGECKGADDDWMYNSMLTLGPVDDDE